MPSTLPPRVVLATRPTELEQLIERHATIGQVRFFLDSRGQSIDELQVRHAQQELAMHRILAAIPTDWRRAQVQRAWFDRFLFQAEDILVVVGQDGLVPNLAKYLDEQPVIGINPSPDRFDGVLVRHRVELIEDLLHATAAASCPIEPRTMVEARLDDGQRLVALNELFIGHRSHQSARYQIRWAEQQEHHSSSGLIIATGTGATGWARSIQRQRQGGVELPTTSGQELVFLVREAFPSAATGTTLTEGTVEPQQQLEIRSEMDEGGVVFGDGIETDFLSPLWGQRITIAAASTSLRLVA